MRAAGEDRGGDNYPGGVQVESGGRGRLSQSGNTSVPSYPLLLLGAPADERPLETSCISVPIPGTQLETNIPVWFGVGGGAGEALLPNQRLLESSRDRSPLGVPLGEKLSPVTSDPATGRA